ncbi:MAG: thiamine pyrophosphate-dependent dehydrogenase E1 component subunit alpha [Clostridiales bacterium]|nr:thiamine pyrophosphate-dependent dehydrogenase E1 component subunit alpha [Clostridiales bacterium]
MELSKERLLKLYKDMQLIRKFEEVVQVYSANGTIPGFVHLSTGEEGAHAGILDCLKKTDYKFPDHRSHGVYCLCGTDPKYVMAELFGKTTGINQGRGGSMHVSDLDCRNMGFNGIQGSTMVTCLGTAFASVYKKTDDVTAVFFGDGTLGEGNCHESMNMAATWHLPIIYCLINNQYAISTHYTESHPQKKLKTWADGYEVTNYECDGNDVEAVVEVMEKAVAQCREGNGPVLVEFNTYRWQGHFAGDPAAYRPEEEVQYWLDRDPVKITKNVLINREGVAPEELDKIDAELDESVAEMLKFSLESPDPTLDFATKYTYADREVEAR